MTSDVGIRMVASVQHLSNVCGTTVVRVEQAREQVANWDCENVAHAPPALEADATVNPIPQVAEEQAAAVGDRVRPTWRSMDQ